MFEYIKFGILVLGGLAAAALAVIGLTSKKADKRIQSIALGLSMVYAILCTMFQGVLKAVSTMLGISFFNFFDSFLRINTTAYIIIGVMAALFIGFTVLSALLFKKLYAQCDAERKGSPKFVWLTYALAMFGMFYANSAWHYFGVTEAGDKLPFWLALDRLGHIKNSGTYCTLYSYSNMMLPDGDVILFSAFGLAFLVIFALLAINLCSGSYTTISVANTLLLYTVAIVAVVLITPLASVDADSWATPTAWLLLAVAIAIRVFVALNFKEKFKPSMIIKNQLG